MPTVSRKRHNLMAACDHGADYPSCPPKSVAHEFTQADKRRGQMKAKYAEGGPVLGRVRDFMKEPDHFRTDKTSPSYAGQSKKPSNKEAGHGKNCGCSKCK